MTIATDDFEEEFGEYANADDEDAMIQDEIGAMVEEEELRTGQVNREETVFEETINAMRRNAVSEGSQNTYLCGIVNLLNWMYKSEANQRFGENAPCRESWKIELGVFAEGDDNGRKKRIREKLDSPDEDDPPLDFESFYAGK